jgi:hypothetical protein
MITPLKKPSRPKKRKVSTPLDEIMAVKQHETPVPFSNDECPPEWYEEVRQRVIEQGGGPSSTEFVKPKKCAIALWRLAQGVAMWRIADETGLDLKTVVRLRWRHTDTLDTRRKEFSRSYAQVADVFTDLLMEKAQQLGSDPESLSKLSPEKLALTVGIMTDKAAQLSGMAGVIIEHRKGPSIEDASQAITAARARIAEKMRAQAIEAEVITEEPEA